MTINNLPKSQKCKTVTAQNLKHREGHPNFFLERVFNNFPSLDFKMLSSVPFVGGDASISSTVESWKEFLGRNIIVESKAVPGTYWRQQDGGLTEVDLNAESQAFR